jgi:hypothetical protein
MFGCINRVPFINLIKTPGPPPPPPIHADITFILNTMMARNVFSR